MNEAAPNTGGIKAQVMSALRWSAIAKFGGQLVSWAITLFVMRLLAPGDYGLVAMLTLIFMFLGMLGEMGFGSSITQAPTLDTREIHRVLRPGGDAFIFVPDDCLGPIDEPEHVIRYNRELLRAFLAKTFDIVSIETMRDANYEIPILFAHVRRARA